MSGYQPPSYTVPEEGRIECEQIYSDDGVSCDFGTWDWHLGSNKLFWSPALFRMFGYEPGSPVDFKDFRDSVHPDDLERWEESVNNCVKQKTSYNIEFRVRHTSGHTLHILTIGFVIFDASGRADRMHGGVIDQTELVEQRQALLESEARLQRMEAIAKIGTWEWDVKHDIVVWSKEIFRFFEIDLEKGAPSVKEQEKLFPPEEYKRLKDTTQRAIERKESYALKLKRVSNNGSIWTCLARGRPKLNPQGDVVSLWGFLEDITELEEIDQERELLKAAIEQSDEMVLITDADERIIYANPALLENTGYSLEELRDKTPRILSSGKQSDTFFQDMWSVLLQGKTWRGRMIDKRKDGSLFTEDATISPVLNSEGKTTHYVGIKRDITEELAQEAMLAESQRADSIGRLAGGIAHDFNNMLQVIIGHVEHAQRQADAGNPLLPTLNIILEAAQRSGRLTGQILAFAREQTASPRVIFIHERIESLLEMLRRIIGEDITLSFEYEEQPMLICIDPAQLDQIITNLCVNARDAIANEGSICISLERVEVDQTYRLTGPDMELGEYVCLSVTDTGCGMSEDILEKIFDPFFTTKPQGEGTGLGLSTVYGIVKQNGGNIHAYSEVGVGTTFRIYFPRAEKPEESDNKPEQHATEAFPSNCTVMIVEDEPLILELSALCLQEMGMEVISVSDPEEALRFIKKNKAVDILMTDVVMPHMNGRELAEAVQQHCPAIKILYMSGYPANVVAKKGLLPSETNFLAKPYSMEDLMKAMNKLLRASQPHKKEPS